MKRNNMSKFIEMKCPKCGGDMKEYAQKFLCRNCDWVYKKEFPIYKGVPTSK